MSNKMHLENTANESPKTNTVIDVIHKTIVDDLIDDAILSLCFECHREEKLKYFRNSDNNPEIKQNSFFITSAAGDKKKPVYVHCYICTDKADGEKFCKHLESCMGCSDNKRKASQKIKSFKESEGESEYSDSDARHGSSKKKTKKGNNRCKQSRRSSNSFPNYKDMTQEERAAFFEKHCGVLPKGRKMPCKMTANCTRHSDEERKNVRNAFLSIDENIDC